jgi:hypothetical protein
MKSLIIMFSLFVSTLGSSQRLPNTLTRSERKFVRNVIEVQKEKVIEIIKRADSHIVIEFETTMVVLKPDGYVGETWILEDGDWLSLGTEEDAY